MCKDKIDFFKSFFETSPTREGVPNNIVLLAGTSCSGKTSLITDLIANNINKLYAENLGNLSFLELEEMLNEGSRTLILSQNNIGIDYYERIIKRINIEEDIMMKTLYKVCKYKQINSFSNMEYLEKYIIMNQIKYVFVDDFNFSHAESNDFLNFARYCYNNDIFILFSVNIRKPAEMNNWHSIALDMINYQVLRISTHAFLVDLNTQQLKFQIYTLKNVLGIKDVYEFGFERI